MKKISAVGGILILLASIIQSPAIEGLKVSVQSTNAVLSWPSATNETYVAQYSSNLNAASWITLTNYLPAADGTNVTFFVHSNSVTYPPLIPGGTNGDIIIDPNNTNTASGGTNTLYSTAGFYRVVRDGAHIYGLTNGATLSGEVRMPIEIAVDSTDHIEGVTFFNSSDDSPVIGASASANPGGGWTFDWNTSMAENGSYSIYAEVDFSTDDPVSSAAIPVSLSVDNTISFPNYFSRIFGSQMWIYAETIPDAAYTIDMYDENMNYFGTFSDYADDDGVISFLWDLTDGEGDTFSDTNFFGVFTVDTSSPEFAAKAKAKCGAPRFLTLSPKKTFGSIKANGVRANDSGSSASATQTWAQETGWASNDKFVVAYAALTDPGTDPNTSAKEALMMIGGDGGEYGGVVSQLSDYGLAYQLSPGNVAQSSAFELQDATTRTNLLSYLADGTYRNFYFFGHGNPTVISGVTPHTAINSFTIAQTLGNFLTGTKPQNFHPYRLVFIDGCDVGKGGFCQSFGIPSQTLNNSFFATAGVRSRAFLGFKNSISFNVSEWSWRSLMLGGFFADWMEGAPLQTCVNNAVSATHSSGFQPMDSSWVIYGAADLQKGSP